MSSSRKEFDVKQILRIRWRWFGHPTSPPPHSQPPLGDFFSGRGTAGSSGDLPSVSGCSTAIGSARNGNSTGSSSSGNAGGSVGNLNNRKFGDTGSQSSGPVPTGATSCPRSYSQQECRSPPALPWVPPPHSRSVLGVTTEVASTNPSVEKATGDGDNNNNVDSDSSSCRSLVKLESLEDTHLLEGSDDSLSDKHGCPAYVSPEILNGSGSYSGKAADVWSLGVMLYTILVGRYPFHDVEPGSLFSKIRRGHFSLPETLSPKARCLIRSLLRRQPAERLTARELLDHPWFAAWAGPTAPPTGGHGRADREQDQAVPEVNMEEELEQLFS